MALTKRYLGPGNLWTLIIGIVFIIWGIFAVIYPNKIPGSWWMFIPGGILLIIGFSNVINYRYNRERILAALKSYERVEIKQLSDELRLSKDNVKSVIVDLRTEGRLKASFDPESEEVVVFEVDGQPTSSIKMMTEKIELPPEPLVEDVISPEMKSIKAQGYCPYCGSRIQEKDNFCVTCGAALK